MPNLLARHTRWALVIAWLLTAIACVSLAGCAGSASGGEGETSGPEWSVPASITSAEFDAAGAQDFGTCQIDTSGASNGYVGFAAQNSARLKAQVIKGQMTYNYDLPGDGTPIICPLNMGTGSYEFRIMQNTSDSNYIQIASTSCSASFDEDAPFIRPNIFCDFDETSACVSQARQLAADAKNQGDAVKAIYSYIAENIKYDDAKAATVVNATGYIPNPDQTLSTKRGICFDYASLAGAMLRSLGIPCKIITGYVSPDGIYHAWNMIRIDGTWTSAHFSVNADEWTRVDLTFAAGSGSSGFVGDGVDYTDRYEY